jgi:hypothetical protein
MEEETPKILKVKEWAEKQRAEAFLKEINQHFNTKNLNVFISKEKPIDRQEKYHKAYLKMMASRK